MSLLNRCFKELSPCPDIKISWVLVCALYLVLTSLQAHSKTELSFLPEKNNLLTLPQKFEYSLGDSYKLLLGNRIIDTSLLSFQILNESSDRQIALSWPSQIFEKAHLRILNPSGVAIWSDEADAAQNSKTLLNATKLLQQLSGLSFLRGLPRADDGNGDLLTRTDPEGCGPTFPRGKSTDPSKACHHD
ncbi:MAG: hypothetical protein ACK5Y2_05395 [Bdellovibrionales bacterium]